MQKQVFKIVTKEQGGAVTREYPMKEATSIATKLGMDMEVDARYLWFLKQAMIALLPKGWKRESDPKGRIKYHNTQTNATTATHPLLYQYRIAFFRLLERSTHQGENATSEEERQATVEEELLFQTLVDEQKSTNPQRDAALRDADEFYASVIGITETRPPHFIEEMAEYQQASPTEMLEMAHKLGIGNDYRYFWIARMALIVPLPPCFETTFDAIGHTKYLNTEHNVLLEVHPAVNYLQKLVSRLRHKPSAANSEMMFFYDKQLMPYVVDLTSLVSGSELYRIHSDTAACRGLLKSRRALYHEERGMKEVIEDMMLLELTRSANINLTTDLHLVGVVHQFIQRLVKDALLDKWNFRYTIEGEHYWYHTPEERAYRRFPYTKTLKGFVKKKKKKMDNKLKNYIRIPAERHLLFRKYGDELCDAASEEACLMMTSLLKHMLETNQYEMPKQEIDVEEVFKCVSEKMTRDDVLDALFSNPFVIDDRNFVQRQKEKSLDVSTDSEIFNEAGFKLEGDKIILVVKEKEKVDRKQAHGKGMPKARIVPRRRDNKMQTVKLGPDAMLPFQVQVGKILQRMKTMRQEQTQVSSSSSPTGSDDSSLTEEEEDKVANLSIRRTRLLGLVPEPRQAEDPAPSDPSSSLPLFTPSETKPGRPLTPTLTLTNVTLPVRRVRRIHTSKAPQLEDIDSNESFPRKSYEYTQDSPTQETSESSHMLEVVGVAKDSKRGGKSEDAGISRNSGLFTTRVKSMQEPPAFMETHEEFFLSPSDPKPPPIKKSVIIPEVRAHIDDSFGESIAIAGEGVGDRHRPVQRDVPVPRIAITILPEPQTHTEPDIEPAETQEQAAIRQLMGKVTEEVAESYLDALGMSLNSDSAPRSSHGTTSDKKPVLSSSVRNEIILGGLKKILEPEIAKRREYFSKSQMTSPRPAEPHSRFPPVTERSALKTRKQIVRKEPPVSTSPFEHTEAFRTTETAAVKAGQRQIRRMKRPATHASPLNGDGLPENFVLSPSLRSSFSPQSMLHTGERTQKAEVQLLNFLHYLDKIGFPMSTLGDQCRHEPTGEILPQHVLKMGKRLGLQVSSVKFASAESDLLWIPLLQLSCPLPRHSSTPSQVQSLILLPLGDHPGDEFFMLMTSFNRRIRAVELSHMQKEDRVSSMVRDSWLCLSTVRNQKYFYNFLTGCKTQFVQVSPQEQPDLSKDDRVQMLRNYLQTKLSKQSQPLRPAMNKDSVSPKTSLNLASMLTSRV